MVYIGVGKEKPRLKDINNFIVPQWAPQWRQLGVQLEFSNDLMNIIECDHPNDSETCCSKMLSDWLDSNTAATWEDLIVAVDNMQSCGTCVHTYMHSTCCTIVHIRCVLLHYQ